MDEQARCLSLCRSDEGSHRLLKQSVTLADGLVVAAIGSGIHMDHDVDLHSKVIKTIEALLCTKTICEASGNVQGCSPMASVFGAVQRMCAVGVKNPELFSTLLDRFPEVMAKDAHSVNTEVLLDEIVLLCGKITKFIEGN